MIKNLLLLPFLLFLLSSCKYGSSFEAKEACEKRKKKGGEFSVLNLSLNSFALRLRDCRLDKLTNKYLGYEYKKLKKNKQYTGEEYYKKEKRVVVKRFSF